MLTCEHFHDDGKLLLGPLSHCSHPADSKEQEWRNTHQPQS